MDANNARDGDRDLVIDLLNCDRGRLADLDLIDNPGQSGSLAIATLSNKVPCIVYRITATTGRDGPRNLVVGSLGRGPLRDGCKSPPAIPPPRALMKQCQPSNGRRLRGMDSLCPSIFVILVTAGNPPCCAHHAVNEQ
jgi:hypothetical protein